MYLIERLVLQSRVTTTKTDGLVALTINYLFLQFATGMVGLFGVLFIFQLGANFNEGMLFVLAFFGLQRLFVALFIPLIGDLVSRVGYRWVMFGGIMALVLKLFLFTLVSTAVIWPLFPAFILGSFTIPAYYLAFHALFLDDNDDKRIGEQIGLLTLVGNVSQVASPLVAGVIIDVFGFNAMFWVAMVVLVISSLPLLSMKSHARHEGKFSVAGIWEFIKSRPKLSKSLLYWYLTAGIQMFLWPIYLVIVLASYTAFGIVASISLVANSISLFLVGKAYDKRRMRKLFLTATLLVSATWVGRFMSMSAIFAAGSDVLNRFFSPFWWMKMRRTELVEGEKIDGLVFGAAHEYLATAGLLLGLVLGYSLLVISGGNWQWLIIPTVLGTLLGSWYLKDR